LPFPWVGLDLVGVSSASFWSGDHGEFGAALPVIPEVGWGFRPPVVFPVAADATGGPRQRRCRCSSNILDAAWQVPGHWLLRLHMRVVLLR